MTEIPVTCNVEPFRYQATPQPVGDQGASSNQINEQSLEDYLNRLRTAICEDLTTIFNAGDVLLSFLQLTDTPDTYVGSGGLAVAVNAGETGLEFVPFPDVPPPPTYFLTPRLIAMYPPSVTTAFGPALTVVGGGQIQIPASPGSALAGAYRQGWSATGANAVGGGRSTVFQMIRGTSAGMGGFRLRWRFGLDLYAAGARCWIGVFATNGFPGGATEPSAAVDCVWLGFDSTDANWQIMHNDNTLTCTKVNLGASWAIANLQMFEVTFECEPNGSTIDYLVRNLVSGLETSGTLSTNLPRNTQPLIPLAQIGAAATGATNRIGHIFMSIEVGPGE